MNNAKPPNVAVPLELMDGLYTEATPESLPPGASPLTINNDYEVGSTGPRPGKHSEYYYADFFEEEITGFAQSIPGLLDPNEEPWSNPVNATKDIPGTYTIAILNEVDTGSGGFDAVATGTGASGSPISLTATGSDESELALTFTAQDIVFETQLFNPGAPWTLFHSIGEITFYQQLTAAAGPVTALDSSVGLASWCGAITLWKGVNPTANNYQTLQSGAFSSFSAAQNVNPDPGSTLIVGVISTSVVTGFNFMSGVSDTQGNSYISLANAAQFNGVAGGSLLSLFYAPNVVGGANTISGILAGTLSGATAFVIELKNVGIFAPPTSQILRSFNFPFAIPPTVDVLGFQVEVSGLQTSLDPETGITVQLKNPATDSPSFFTQLPLSNGTVDVATPTTKWGLTVAPAVFNDPNFGIDIVASSLSVAARVKIYAVKVKVWLTPDPPPSFNYIKTFAQTDGDTNTLALGDDGIMFSEDVINNQGVLNAVYTAIEPDTFAESCTQSDREFIALSNLLNGTDIPYTYDGQSFQRLSQVGPGAPPSVSTSSTGETVVTITQTSPKSDPEAPGRFSELLWSTGPGLNSPGNILTVYYARVNHLAVPDVNLFPGAGVVIAGAAPINGQTINGFYNVQSTGQNVPPQAQFGRWYFTVVMPTTQYFNSNQPEGSGPVGTYQATIATMTTAGQIPNLEVGNTFQLAGTGGAPPAGYDGAWSVLATPNASQVQITSTALSGGVATYGFNLVTGVNPVVGQFITITQTLNGNGVFNVVNGVITAASPGNFSLSIAAPDVTTAAETGSGIVFGTIFQFDPQAIVGTRSGGSIVTSGIISAGTRQICYSFLTDNGYITKPSPITTIEIPSGASSLVVANLLTGPSNVIARIIHLTGANGGNFFNIPQPVTVNNNGVNVINSSTYLNDNTSSSISLSFSDGVLLAATAIDIEGNNLFETAELGSCLMLIPYAARVFCIGEQNKLTTMLNWSFDGGIIGGAGSAQIYPAGWTIDATNGAGGSVINSPIFGFAYSINNASGITQAIYGMITQPMFENEFKTPIIEASTTYSVRVTIAVPSGPTTGNVVIDLFSPSFNKSFGSFTVPLASIGTTMGIFTGTILTTPLAPVPNDLVIRIYATNILNGVTVNFDRIEPFPTEQPNLTTDVTGSYVNNFEAFDQVEGVIGCAVQNQQPVKSGFTLFDTFYLVKSGSFISTQDNGTTEPNHWQTRVVSNSVGTPSIYGVTTGIDEPNSGEEWAIVAGEPGAYIFNGGEPIKLTEEIQSLWNLINWKYGHTLWVKNDIVNRRILFGVPLKTQTTSSKGVVTQNKWLPAGLIAADENPTTPNVVIELNYKQLNTAGSLSEKVAVHTSYSGKLIASEIVRKWSIWTIKAPCAAFVTRFDKTTPLFIGNSDATGKIYSLIEGLLEDDGAGFTQLYDTYGFVTQEQAQALQLGSVRKIYEYMTTILNGSGPVQIKVFPNSLDTPYAHALLPNLTLPASTDGDVEIPVNETGSRLFLQFSNTGVVGAGFILSNIVLMMRSDPWSPVRGRN